MKVVGLARAAAAFSFAFALALPSGCTSGTHETASTNVQKNNAKQATTASSENGKLENGTIARVGSTAIPASLVSSVAAAQNLAPRDALDALIDDALFAEAAHGQMVEARPATKVELLAAEARLVARKIREDAIAAGPPTDAEVAELTAVHWAQFDRPEEVEGIHAVVQRKPKQDAQTDKAAIALANALAKAVAGSTDADDFERRIKAVPPGNFDVHIDRLAPFPNDERSGLVPEFAHAAFAIPTGTTSGVFESRFGWHVMLVTKRIPPYTAPLEERRSVFAAEAREHRGEKALAEILTRQRAAVRLESPTAVDAILREAKLP